MIETAPDTGHVHAETVSVSRHSRADRTESDHQKTSVAQNRDAVRLELNLRPFARGLPGGRGVQLAAQRERKRDRVFGDGLAVASARVRDDDATLDRLTGQQRSGADGRGVNPAQPRRQGELRRTHPRRHDHVRRWVFAAPFVGLAGVHDLVGREAGGDPGDLRRRHGPHRRIVNRDDNSHV